METVVYVAIFKTMDCDVLIYIWTRLRTLEWSTLSVF